MNQFLITTALEETWRDGEPVLFLGEWCRLYHRQRRWSSMPAEVLPYHWDDRAKMFADYEYLRAFHERLLIDLAAQLNQIHSVDHDVRYWRILTGPWLGYFTQSLFDRWSSVQQAVRRGDVSETIVLVGNEDSFVPNDMAEFIGLAVGDEWNHRIYGEIVRRFTDLPSIAQPAPPRAPAHSALRRDGVAGRLKQMVARGYVRAAGLFTRESDAFLINTYLPPAAELGLNRRLGQVPQRWRSIPPVRVAIDQTRRRWTVSGETDCAFERCARELIPAQIPASYLEGYHALVAQAEALPWPKRPKVIWTSNSYNSDEVFKAWAAEKIERHSPLIVGQHGGHYGAGRWSFFEDHEIAICDRYLSWGWSSPSKPKVQPLGQFVAKQPLGVQHGRQRGALLVTAFLPRYSYAMYSAVVARQSLDYFEDQCAFVEHLPDPVRAALTVRLYAQDYGWDQAMRWRDRFPQLQLDSGRADIHTLMRTSKLFISTYNATTFLESFSMNVPTLMYWNPNHWELRDSAVPYYDELKGVGILHDTPDSAARQAAEIWHDVDAWWNGSELRGALSRFTKRFCRVPDDIVRDTEAALRDVIASSGPRLAAAT